MREGFVGMATKHLALGSKVFLIVIGFVPRASVNPASAAGVMVTDFPGFKTSERLALYVTCFVFGSVTCMTGFAQSTFDVVGVAGVKIGAAQPVPLKSFLMVQGWASGDRVTPSLATGVMVVDWPGESVSGPLAW